MSTLIIGASCSNGLVLAADRRELRGFEPSERSKINKIGIHVGRRKGAVLLAGAGIAAFWDEVAWSLPRLISGEGEPNSMSLLDVVDRISSLSINLSARYQRDGLDERLGCVVAGLDDIVSGKPELYYFAGAGFSKTDFICLGSGDRYALPMADILLHQKELTIEQAVQAMPFLFLLVERVNLSVGEGPDIFVLRPDRQPIAVPIARLVDDKGRAAALVEELPSVVLKTLESRVISAKKVHHEE
jgi:20S proteasome alpha/beta subunit